MPGDCPSHTISPLSPSASVQLHAFEPGDVYLHVFTAGVLANLHLRGPFMRKYCRLEGSVWGPWDEWSSSEVHEVVRSALQTRVVCDFMNLELARVFRESHRGSWIRTHEHVDCMATALHELVFF